VAGSGVFNVAQEGLMALGASAGFLVSFSLGSRTLGVLVAALAAGLIGLVLAWATTGLRLDQFVVGLALFFAAIGIAGLLFRVVVGQSSSTPLLETIPRLEIPLLSDIPVLGPILLPTTCWSTARSCWPPGCTSCSTGPGWA
jgi:simple sugar transport system permease protein